VVRFEKADQLKQMRSPSHPPHPEEPAPISGLPEIGIIDAQVGYSRPACGRLEGWATGMISPAARPSRRRFAPPQDEVKIKFGDAE
jgi:hypothetical protein